MRLILLAYLTDPESFLVQVSVQTFVDAVRDAETQQPLRLHVMSN